MNRDRGLFYTRDSSGQHDQTLAEYIRWAQGGAKARNLRFDGTPEIADNLISAKRSFASDIYIDWCVKGNTLSRPGLDALKRRLVEDPTIACVFIPKRDRLARPNDPTDGMQLERNLRRYTDVVFIDGVVSKLGRNGRQELGELMSGALSYYNAGQFRHDQATKAIYAKQNLARQGYSTGGRAPFGFRRALVNDRQEIVRPLADGECVKMFGHHVVLVRGPDEEINLILRIIRMVEEMPVNRIAKMLNQEGVPAPDADRMRTDNGILHYTRGTWNPTTIRNIIENPLLSGQTVYGRRSMGDQLRHHKNGPRQLIDSDFLPNDRPKVIRNPIEDHIFAQARIEPLVSVEKHSELLELLASRGASQRGKPRSRNPENNPLGARVYDANCGWPMYRTARKETYQYVCGLYSQSNAHECAHNHIDGPTAVAFVLSAIRQLLPQHSAELRDRLRAIALREQSNASSADDSARQERQLAKIEADLKTVKRNLAFAKTPEQFSAVAEQFEELKRQRELLVSKCKKARASIREGEIELQIAAAIDSFERLTELAPDKAGSPAISKLINSVNARLFLNFQLKNLGKRKVNRLASGVLTLGAAPAPRKLYDGPTGKKHLAKISEEKRNADMSNFVDPSPEDQLSGNVNRGDMI